MVNPAAGADPLRPEELGALSRELGLELSRAACDRLIAYVDLLQRWNRVHNLTAVTSAREILSHHLLDCLAVAVPLAAAMARDRVRRDIGTQEGAAGGGAVGGEVRDEGRDESRGESGADNVRWLDVGSGAGLPGVVLAIVLPQWHATLVDAVQKKCAFLQQVQVELGLANITVRHARVQDLAGERFDLIACRAFASLLEFVDLTAPCLRPGGWWAAMKGRRPDAEIAALPDKITVVETIKLRVPLLPEQRHLVLLRPAAPADNDTRKLQANR